MPVMNRTASKDALTTQTHRLTYRPTGVCELYDLAQDPLELNNRFGNPDCAAIQQSLQNRILEWLVQTSDVTPFKVDPRGYS